MYSVLLIALLLAACLVQPSQEEVLNNGEVFQLYPEFEGVPSGTTPLYFALMQSFGGSYVSSGGIPGLMVALDEINSNSTVLPGYSLHYTLSDSACVRFRSQRTLFNQLRENRTKIAAMGSGCSLATEPAAEISHFWNIPQISCDSTSPALRDRPRFRDYYQTIGSEELVGLAYFGVVKHYGWKQVTILQLDIDLFEAVTLKLKEMLQNFGVRVIVRTFEEDRGIEGLGENPFDDSSRIYVWLMYSNFGRQLLCKAYERGFMYPRFTFLYPTWWVGDWWVGENTENFTCTVVDRERVVYRSIVVELYEFIEDYDDVAQTGTNGHQYEAAFNEHYENFTAAELGAPLIYGQACYDATWILALALNSTLTDLVENSTLNSRAASEAGIERDFRLEKFTYNNTPILEVLSHHLANTDFHGISGRVNFDSDGIRAGTRLFIYQMRYLDSGLKLHDIARVNENFTFTYTNNETDESVWPVGILYDGVPREDLVTVHISVTVLVVSLAFCGIVLTIVCLVFNFVFCERRLIRLTSPKLNYLIGVGAVLLYLGICTLVYPSTDPHVVKILCNMTPWLTSVGFSLCFGTIMAKMARIFYTACKHKSGEKRAMKDYHLALFVCALVTVDVVILSVYTLVEGLRGNLEPTRTVNAENPLDTRGVRGVEYRHCFYGCSSTLRDVILGFLYGYKIVLQGVTVVMALKTRKANVQGLNDYQEVVLATYLTTFVLVIYFVVIYTMDDGINSFAAVTSFSIFIGATAIILLVFVPKMIGLYKDPTGKNSVFSEAGPSVDTDVKCLQERVVQLEKQLTESVKNVQLTNTGEANRVPGMKSTPTDTSDHN